MCSQPLLHLITSASPLIILAWYIDPTKVRETLNQATRYAVLAQEQARAQRVLGTLYCQFDDWERATEFYLLSSDWARIAGDAEALGMALNGLGTVMLYRQRYKLAYRFFREAVQVLKPTKDHSQYALALHNLGVVYHLLGCSSQKLTSRLHSAALKLLKKAHAVRSEVWDVTGEAITLIWMGRAYCSQNQFAYALACYEAARDLSDPKAVVFEGCWFEVGLHCLIATLAEQCNHPELAIGHYLNVLELAKALGSEWSFPILQALSRLHSQLENPSTAIYYRQQALKVAKQTGALSGEGNLVAVAETPFSYFVSNHPLSLYF